MMKKFASITALALALAAPAAHARNAPATRAGDTAPASTAAAPTATPIKHLVIIFGENESFDHYFGTYPHSADPRGEPTQHWRAPANVATVDNYVRNPALLSANPNTTSPANLALAREKEFSADYMNPFRIDRAQFDTAGQSHAYTDEQRATDSLKMDAFVRYTGHGTKAGAAAFGTPAQVMGYFDGNTVTALWNYAQNYAMSDNAWTDSFGPSTPGAINVVSGTTAGAITSTGKPIPAKAIDDGTGAGTFTLIGDPDPTGDVCSKGPTATMTGRNIGNLLDDAGITWGGFMGGFDLTRTNANATTGCARSTMSPHTGRTQVDYTPHHAWFQYYPSTRNVNHTRPASVAMIGHTEPGDTPDGAKAVNHQYDIRDFRRAVAAGNFPAVSYIKAPSYQDAHPGNSNALDEQDFIVRLINFLSQRPEWKNTAIILAYDDSDGWYDHRAPHVTNASFDAHADQMNGPGQCTGPDAKKAMGIDGKPVNGRCGPGTRVPFLIVSPWARRDYVSTHAMTQASIIRFIEDNWLKGERIGGGSDDASAQSIMDMFDFKAAPRTRPFCLDPDKGTRLSTCPAVAATMPEDGKSGA